jgi:pimeloyl-ACP methyl ester carboxylesterase
MCCATSISVSPKVQLARDYQAVQLPAQSSLIIEEAAQVLLSSLLVGSVSVPSFVSDRDVPTSFARFRASSTDRTTESKPSFIESVASKFLSKEKTTKKLAPIVLLHGFDSSAIEYRRLAPLIAQKRDVYAPDILGWGFSDHTDVISFTPAAKLAHLKSFIKEVVGEPCIVVGASLGGAIAILLATESPELVERVVLIDAQVTDLGPFIKSFMFESKRDSIKSFLSYSGFH